MARIRYYYDTESCQFDKAGFTWKSLFYKGVSHIFVGLVTCASFGSMLFIGLDNPKHKAIRVEINTLKADVERFDGDINSLNQEILDLQILDTEFHSNILKMDVDYTPSQPFGEPASPYVLGKESMPGTMNELNTQLNELDAKIKNQTSNFIALEEKLREKGNQLRNIPSERPVKSPLVSGFGQRKHPLLKIDKKHTGMDFAAPIGTPVVATADGEVNFVGTSANGYGLHIDLNHGVGFQTRYAHLSKITVAEGKRVKRGEVIGFSGNSGLVKGAHLHYEIILNGEKVDPVDYFYTDIGPEEYVEFKRIAGLENESMD